MVISSPWEMKTNKKLGPPKITDILGKALVFGDIDLHEQGKQTN